MKKSFALTLLVAGMSCAESPKENTNEVLEAAAPESVGLSPERLNRIDAMLEGAIADTQIPGAVALITRNGKIVYHKAFGHADAEREIPFETDAIFRIASQTKAITSAAVLMLWEEGNFRLDDPI